MDDWTKDFFKAIETAMEDAEQFLHEVAEEVDETIDWLAEVSEDFSKQLDEAIREIVPLDEIVTEIDRTSVEAIDSILDVYLEVDWQVDEEVNDPDPPVFVSYVSPSDRAQPACVGCRHYHGYVYSGNLLVCGMHPEGWDGENCPDWEGETDIN